MLVSFSNSGQFGNAYLASAYRIAHALEYNYSLRCYDLGGYLKYLKNPEPEGSVTFGSETTAKIAEAAFAALRLVNKSPVLNFGNFALHRDKVGVSSLPPELLAKHGLEKKFIHRGWRFRDREALNRNADAVRRILGLKFETEQTQSSARDLKSETRVNLIGVHVRRGDYADFHSGKYFFEDSTYLRMAGEAIDRMGMPKEKTIICGLSNTRLDWPSEFEGIRVMTPGKDWLSDIEFLSHCDLIIGPPSTFSGAASFIGDVRWFQIKDRNASFDATKVGTYLQSGIRLD